MRHSPHDADAMDRYEYDVERVCQVVKPLLDKVPPNIFGKSPEDLAETAELVEAPRRRGARRSSTTWSGCSPAAPPTSSTTTSRATSSRATSPPRGSSAPRSARCRRAPGWCCSTTRMGEHDGHFGAWSFHKGGNGGFTQVLARAAQAYGAEIMLNAPVDSVITKDGAAVGVALEDGTELTAKTVGQRPRPAAHVHPAGRAARAARRPGREHQPDAGSRAPPRRSTSPSTARRGTRRSATAPTSTSASSTSGRPWSTSSEPSTTPSTAGTASGPTSTAPSSRSSTRTWRRPASTSCRASCSTRRTTSRAATGTPSARGSPTPCRRPSSRSSPASATSCCSARSRRRSTSSARSGSPRATSSPASSSPRRCTSSGRRPGWSQYRTPIDGYYQCGSGTHPGGCVMGAPGKLASQQILKDLRARDGRATG